MYSVRDNAVEWLGMVKLMYAFVKIGDKKILCVICKKWHLRFDSDTYIVGSVMHSVNAMQFFFVSAMFSRISVTIS